MAFEMSSESEDLLAVLIGSRGAVKYGKNNLLLGKNKPRSLILRNVQGHSLSVVNMLGQFKKTDSPNHSCVFQNEISVFLLVIKLPSASCFHCSNITRRLRKAEITMAHIQRLYGETTPAPTMILFTKGDNPITDFEQNADLKKLLNKCSKTWHMCNKRMNNHDEISELVDKIKSITQISIRPYTVKTDSTPHTSDEENQNSIKNYEEREENGNFQEEILKNKQGKMMMEDFNKEKERTVEESEDKPLCWLDGEKGKDRSSEKQLCSNEEIQEQSGQTSATRRGGHTWGTTSSSEDVNKNQEFSDTLEHNCIRKQKEQYDAGIFQEQMQKHQGKMLMQVLKEEETAEEEMRLKNENENQQTCESEREKDKYKPTEQQHCCDGEIQEQPGQESAKMKGGHTWGTTSSSEDVNKNQEFSDTLEHNCIRKQKEQYDAGIFQEQMQKHQGKMLMQVLKEEETAEEEMRLKNENENQQTCESEREKDKYKPTEQQHCCDGEIQEQPGQESAKMKGDNTWDATLSENRKQDVAGKITEDGLNKEDLKIKIPDIFCRLHLSSFYAHKLATADVFHVSKTSFETEESRTGKEPVNEENMVFVYLHKLLTLDYRARSVTPNKKSITSETGDISGENEDFDDFLSLANECSNSKKDENSQIHPMDIQMAVFQCADSFLKQNMVTKLSSCQYALPLLVPSPTDIELPLWTFRQIKKTWKSVGGSSTSLPVCQVKAPMVFFCRLGSVSTSKSQLLNSLINPRHDTFFHRDSPGSTRTRLFMEGLVEIAWYCPAGETDDLFSECTAFCNLHGDATAHREQTDFLMEQATVIVVLIQNMELEENARELLQNLYKDSSKYLICVISDLQKGPVKMVSGNNIRIGLRDTNQSELHEELRTAIRTCLQKCNSAPTFCLEESSERAKHCGFRVDEDSEDCQEGKTRALEVMKLLKGEDISQIKTKLLPCQGKLWQEWSSKNKQLYRLYGDVEQTKSKIQQEMKLIRNQQRETSLDLIKTVCRYLNSEHDTKKAYFVRWLGFYLDVSFSEELSEITQQYYKQLLDTHVSKKEVKKDVFDENQEETNKLSEKLDAVTCGLEHIVREMGQIYEAWAERPGEMPAEVSALPAVAADLLISGYPLELMDGDAAHIPLTWIESVLDKVTETLGDQRVFVLSVLGLQSSGKSTMLNTMFGLQFAVSAGRCTRGAFMQLIRVKEEVKEKLRFDYLLVVDTEGLQALELSGKSRLNHDNELATFIISLGNITLINIFGENPAEIQEVLQVAIQAILRMDKVRLNPSCMFVHQNVTDITATEKNMEGSRRLLETLDEVTISVTKAEGCDLKCFMDVIKFNIQTDVHYFAQLWEGNPPMAPPNPRYSENVEKLKQAVFTAAAGKNCLRLSELKVRIRDLWTAVLSEDFVFSFKNSLEIAAYRKLEVMYGNWTWSLRKAMLATENNLQNMIENANLVSISEKMIHEEINGSFCNIKREMEMFFTKDKDVKILTQWKERTEKRIQELKNSLTEVATVKLDQVIKQKERRTKLDGMLLQLENELFNRSKDLASRLKDKAMNEQSLSREFNSLWEKWLSDLRSKTPPVKDVNIEQEVMNILSSAFENCSIYSNRDSGHYKLLCNFPSKVLYSDYVTMKKSKCDFSCYNWNTKDHDSIRELVQETVREAKEIIRTKPVDKTGYSDVYTQEIVNKVKKRVEEFKSERFVLKNEFTVDLSLFVCDIAVRKFTELHRVFREANDPVIYLDNKKVEFFSIFKKQCEGATATIVFTDFICNKLKPSILQSVYDQSAIDAAGEMRANYPALSGNRSNLEKHILQDLAEDENFDQFMTYIKNPKKHFSDFIHTKFKQEMLEGRNPRILEILKSALKMKQSRVFTAIQKTTQETKQNKGGVKVWLKRLSQELVREMKFTVSDLEGVLYLEITDTDFFSEVMNKTLQSVFDDITSSFDHISSVRMDMFRQRPEDILMKQLCGCWVQCPFCAVICTNTIEGHDGDHSVPFHRPRGVNGAMLCKMNHLSVDICSSLVASDISFVLSDNKQVLYKRYREAGPEFACWSITPDTSEQPYWKWFVCRFQKDLEKYYSKTFQAQGEIPTAWRSITKQDAIETGGI